MGVSGLGGFHHLLHGGVGAGVADVVSDGAHKEVGLLGDDADVAAQIFKGDVLDVHAIDGDLSFGHIVEPGNQVDDGGFSGSRAAD